MKITTLEQAQKAPFNLDARIIHSSPNLELVHLCLKSGESIPQHANPFTVVACLVLGSITLHVGNENFDLNLFDSVEIENNLDRGFTNTSQANAHLIIVKKLA